MLGTKWLEVGFIGIINYKKCKCINNFTPSLKNRLE